MAEDPAGGMKPPLIGAAGIEYIATQLATRGPPAISEIQERCGLRPPLCKPAIGMLDHLGISRAEVHRYLLHRAMKELLDRIPMMSTEQLEALLEASFPYLGIEELRSIPIRVMERIQLVPPNYLKLLAEDKAIFQHLPPKVQQEVWEFDQNLLQLDAMPLVASYKYEVATVQQTIKMDEFMTWAQMADYEERRAEDDSAAQGVQRKVTRKMLRTRSKAIQTLRSMVGTSEAIYLRIKDLITRRYRDSESLYFGTKELSVCILRSQVLMALHDTNSDIRRRDSCHELAWTLDACINRGMLAAEHLARLQDFFKPFLQHGPQRGRGSKPPASKKRRLSGRPDDDDDAGSADDSGGAISEHQKLLAEAGMIIRDPPAMHLLLSELVRQLHRCVAGAQLPRDNPQVVFLLRLLELAMQSRQQLREHTFFLPEADEGLLLELLPWLGSLLVEAQLRGDSDRPAPSAEHQVLRLLRSDELARKSVQVFCLERLQAQDMASSKVLLQALAASFRDNAVPEYAPFGNALAARLQGMVMRGTVAPGGDMWQLAVDGLLVRLVDTHLQVHEEVLRLIDAATAMPGMSRPPPGMRQYLPPEQVLAYLEAMLAASEASRAKAKSRQRDTADEQYAAAEQYWYSMASDIGSDRWDVVKGFKKKGADSIKGVYHMVATRKLKGMDLRAAAPQLHSYLSEAAA